MSDEAGLLRAIVETPDDLTLRMVYADWCEEHGRAARSALIRGQCLLDPLLVREVPEYEGEGYDARYLTPPVLSQELRESVLEPFRPFASAAGWEWDDVNGFASARSRWYAVRRGFVEVLNLQGRSQLSLWVAHAPAILVRTPLQSLSVSRGYYGSVDEPDHLPADLIRLLLAVEGIERVRELDLSSYSLGAAAARTLLEEGGKLRLTSLRLRERTLTRRLRDDLQSRFGDALSLPHTPSAEDIPF